MKDEEDEMVTLNLFESKVKPEIDPYEVFTCKECDFGTCERVGRCPKCGGRMLNAEEFEEREEGGKSGFGFIITGFIYLIFPAIYMSSGKFRAADLFYKASDEAYMSVTLFTYIFALPVSFICIGIVMRFIKKDSLWTRLGVFGAVMAVFLALDFIVFPALAR